ncbi:MAG: cobyric acid synthase [Cellulosilyticaceae bacterium]
MAKPLMIQGTTSDAGKSFITAALCRILKQDGYKVAPFKSQNMALNSFITKDGLEMGRAQVMQAEAAGLEPDVRMNPILLKPMTDMGSQVILHGKALQHMEAKEYFQFKHSLVEEVLAAYESLAKAYDVILLEGAGSPAEINLRKGDLVNMGMAELVNSPVLLTGDIDRGGVFAALAGTLMLLEPDEKARVKGMIVNKFRGDVDILKPGLRMIEDIVHVPVVGVVPMLRVDLDEEDSLAVKKRQAKEALIDIVVVQLPHISNFTDFNTLGLVSSASVRYVRDPKEMGNPDMVILPGTKNTMGDLKWLRERGFELPLQKYAARGGVVFGICGGYQMLGQTISDPHQSEGGGTLKGLGLLPIHTVFEVEKMTEQVNGVFGQVTGALAVLSGKAIKGYEIHMGSTTVKESGLLTLLSKEGTHMDGAQCGNVYGSYVHGLFDEKEISEAIVRALLKAKGFDEHLATGIDLLQYKEKQYDLLADGVRQAMDMDLIYRILEKGMGR